MRFTFLFVFLFISCQPDTKQTQAPILEDTTAKEKYNPYSNSNNYPNSNALQRTTQPTPDSIFNEPESDGSWDSLAHSLLHSERIILDKLFLPKHRKNKFLVDKNYKEDIGFAYDALDLPDNLENEFRVFQICEFEGYKFTFHRTGECNLFSINNLQFDLLTLTIDNEKDRKLTGKLKCACEDIKKFRIGQQNYIFIPCWSQFCNGTGCLMSTYLLYDTKNQKLTAFSNFPKGIGFGNFGDVDKDNQLDFIHLEYSSLDSIEGGVYGTNKLLVKMTPFSQNSQGKFVPIKDKQGYPYYVLAKFEGVFFATNNVKVIKKHWFK